MQAPFVNVQNALTDFHSDPGGFDDGTQGILALVEQGDSRDASEALNLRNEAVCVWERTTPGLYNQCPMKLPPYNGTGFVLVKDDEASLRSP